jgi:hypothetical protein
MIAERVGDSSIGRKEMSILFMLCNILTTLRTLTTKLRQKLKERMALELGASNVTD